MLNYYEKFNHFIIALTTDVFTLLSNKELPIIHSSRPNAKTTPAKKAHALTRFTNLKNFSN